jgi:hypothetical protein
MVGGSGDEGVHDSLKPHMMAQVGVLGCTTVGMATV